MKVLKAIKKRSYYKDWFKDESENLKYIGCDLNSNELYVLKPNDKFILQTEKINNEHNIYFESNKYIVKENDKHQIYIEEYKSFYEKYKDIINICIGSILGSILTIITTIIINYLNLLNMK